MGGVGQHIFTPGAIVSDLPRPYGDGKFHLLHGDKQATVCPFLMTLKSPNPLFSFVGHELRAMRHCVVTHVPDCVPGTMSTGKLNPSTRLMSYHD